jgi:transcriptional regulator with XRE-family HTH domain
MKLGNAIKICREQKGLTRTDLALRAKLSVSYISLLENNKRDPILSKVDKIAQALGVPMSVLIFLAADKSEFESISSELAEKLSLLSLKLIEGKHDGEAALS